MRAITTTARTRYVPECDRAAPPESRTTFVLRPLTAREMFDVRTRADEGAPGARIRERLLAAVGMALVGWENLVDENGAAVPFVRDAAKDAAAQPFLDALDVWTVSELAGVILSNARLSGDDRGNSGGPSGSPSGGPDPV